MPTSATAYYPFDSGAGANVTEAQWRNFMSRLAPSAVLANVNNELAPSGDSTGMQVKVATGAAWVRGAYGEWTSGVTTLPIAAVGGIAGGSSRIDSIVARNDFVNNRVELDVLTGTAAVTPAAPALTQSSSIWEILLGNVGPLTNATSTITAAMVFDGRWKMTESGILFHEVSLPVASSVVLPAAGAIPTGYRDISLRILGRTATAATSESLNLRFNGDSGSNYTWSALSTSSATPAGTIPSTTTSIAIGNLTAASAPANLLGFITVEIPEYSNTSWIRIARALSSYQAGGTVFQIGTFFGNWTSTSALNTLTLLTGSAGNFASGRAVLRLKP